VDHDAVVSRFSQYLRERGLPVTAQRLAIADVALSADHHLSAEEIADATRARGHQVGTATVYRTIDILLKSGLLVERDFGEGFRRFEPARDTPHHEHLLCTVCGAVVEFRDERLERMTMLAAETRGYARQSHRLVIYGVCPSCQRDGNAGRQGTRGAPPRR
jgi:Fur family ferric uptake transcriptional regulator